MAIHHPNQLHHYKEFLPSVGKFSLITCCFSGWKDVEFRRVWKKVELGSVALDVERSVALDVELDQVGQVFFIRQLFAIVP